MVETEVTAGLCPPIEMNYNWAGTTDPQQYKEDFAANFVEHFFPYLLQRLREHQIDPARISLLDIGCGFAPMAYAFAIHGSSLPEKDRRGLRYLGIDIRSDAIEWLQAAYKRYDFIQFFHHQADTTSDYVGEGNTDATQCITEGKTSASSTGREAAYKIPDDFSCNLQWSSSVFTHLTPEASATALKTMAACSQENSIQVNTWLVIDDESRYALAAGVADRQLPIDCGKFLTFSEENPLLNTCYKLEAMEEIYQAAGLKIVEIDRGSWRGKAYLNRANHYQDVVVSVLR